MSRSATPTTQSEGGCQSKWCDEKLCVSKWCDDKLCVSKSDDGRRTDGGIQNQKQEPHTKMWGKTCFEYVRNIFFVEHHSAPNGHFWPVFPTKYSQIYFPERIQAANMDDGLRCTTNQSLCDGTLERSHADIPKQQSLRATD